jgi:dTDP-4-amino-4,6-dideoxygalactose transaminase
MRRAFASGYIAPCGPMVDEFDRRLGALSGQHAAAVASGTAALDLLMAELGVGPGDRVVASSLTFVATVGPAVHRGATPVFVDSDPATGLISLPLLRRALRASRPKCVIAADLYGQCCDYDALEALCAEHGVPLVIDAAEAVGATFKGRPAGAAGAASVYSFNGNKIITTSGGGAVLSRDPEIAVRARWRAQQSRENVVWYEHREVGHNYRMSNILAALGIAQLEKLPEIIRRKRAAFERWRRLLDGIAIPFPCSPDVDSTRWLSVFLFKNESARDAMASRLAAVNAESRPAWKPLHLQPVFTGAEMHGGEVCEDFFRRGLCLPCGAGLTESDWSRLSLACVEVEKLKG